MEKFEPYGTPVKIGTVFSVEKGGKKYDLVCLPHKKDPDCGRCFFYNRKRQCCTRYEYDTKLNLSCEIGHSWAKRSKHEVFYLRAKKRKNHVVMKRDYQFETLLSGAFHCIFNMDYEEAKKEIQKTLHKRFNADNQIKTKGYIIQLKETGYRVQAFVYCGECKPSKLVFNIGWRI